jgi:hypothetical protein
MWVAAFSQAEARTPMKVEDEHLKQPQNSSRCAG